MTSKKKNRPSIPIPVKNLLWLRAGGRCEFRGCNEILYEDKVTKNPINVSNIAHIISLEPKGPRGDEKLSPALATNIDNLMLVCPSHHMLIDNKDMTDKYSISFLKEMKREHEDAIRYLTGLRKQPQRKIIELQSLIQGQRPSITNDEEVEALFPFFPQKNKVIIDLCDIEDISVAKTKIKEKVHREITYGDKNEEYVAFIMAKIPLACYLGYVIGNKVSVQTFQRFRDTEDWKWRTEGGGFIVRSSDQTGKSDNVNLCINVSGIIDNGLLDENYPCYSISADEPGFNFLQSWDQVLSFRSHYRSVLDVIRCMYGEAVTIHLYLATPNPISFEVGRGIMKNIDPTIVLYDKMSDGIKYKEIMHLHDRIRKQ